MRLVQTHYALLRVCPSPATTGKSNTELVAGDATSGTNALSAYAVQTHYAPTLVQDKCTMRLR
eukprot:1765946-Rhodomonas_salina.3